MFLYRVMNEFDIVSDPIKNGVASKELIYNATKRYLYNTNREYIESLNEKDRDSYIKEYMIKYLKDHKYKLGKIFESIHSETKNNIKKFVSEKDNFAYCKMLKDISTLPSHLVTGSKTYTNWISTTNDFDSIWKYYDRQNVHEIMIMDVFSNGCYDENTYVVNLSNKDVINKIRFISNKIDEESYEEFIEFFKENPELQDIMIDSFNKFIVKPTSKKFMGYNFASSSNEYCIYEYLSKHRVIARLESLEIDLICASLFDDDYLLLSPGKRASELKRLKDIILKHILEENDPYMLYVFEELYLNKHNINEIVDNEDEKDKMILMRNTIISKSQFLNSPLITRKKLINS